VAFAEKSTYQIGKPFLELHCPPFNGVEANSVLQKQICFRPSNVTAWGEAPPLRIPVNGVLFNTLKRKLSAEGL
jgi:hypothetical protein